VKPKQRKLIINILTIAVPILSTIAIYFGLQFILATTTPFVAVASGSMSPALEVGDLVIVQGVPPTDIQVGDIIVFDPPQGDQTIHRVTRNQTLPNGTFQFKTKGDANPSEDRQWIPEQNVHGRVSYRIPYLGWLALEPTIPIIIIIIIIILILFWPEKRRKRKKIFQMEARATIDLTNSSGLYARRLPNLPMPRTINISLRNKRFNGGGSLCF